MSLLTIPNVFVNGATINAAPFNVNFAAITTWSTNIDNTNIGAAGIFASQVVPTTAGQATFGGTPLYTFPAGVAAGGPLTATTVTGSSGTYSGTLIAGSATAPVPTSGSVVSSIAATVGAFYLGGSTEYGILDYGASVGHTWTFSSVGGSSTTNLAGINNLTMGGALAVTGTAATGALTVTGLTTVTGKIFATSSIAAGSATVPATTAGDLWASRSTTTGQLNLGGSSTVGTIDYGVSSVSQITITGNTTITGSLLTKQTFSPGIGGVVGSSVIYGGTGAPVQNAPNGSLYLRYDGPTASTVLYMNTSGASTSGTTWSAVTIP